MNLSFSRKYRYYLILLFSIVLFFTSVPPANAQGIDRIEKARMKDILNNIKKEVKKNYYDPNFHGIDIEDRFKKAEDRLELTTSVSQSFSIIAQVLIDFNDSHLYFLPPPTNLAVEYGWRIQMIGNKCFVTQVRPKSDAEAKGLKVGDQLIAIEGFKPSKKELWKVLYHYNVLSIRDKVKLTVLSPKDEQPRELTIQSQIKKRPRVTTFQTYFRLGDNFYNEENDKHRFQTVGNIVVWRMPSFDYNPTQVDQLMTRVKDSNSLILDLRGNGGGYVKTLEQLTGYFFDKDMKIADMKGRKETTPSLAKTRGSNVFKGKLVVLIDSNSGSAAEIFARLVQLEKRGTILGDVSSGAVMQSVAFDGEMGTQNIIVYGASITNADVIMSDGKSIEHIGVIPDELILTTGEDFAGQKDPVLARAAALLGGNLPPEVAGKFFPYYWYKD